MSTTIVSLTRKDSWLTHLFPTAVAPRPGILTLHYLLQLVSYSHRRRTCAIVSPSARLGYVFQMRRDEIDETRLVNKPDTRFSATSGISDKGQDETAYVSYPAWS
jgi:hypothetical protein